MNEKIKMKFWANKILYIITLVLITCQVINSMVYYNVFE